MRQCRHRQSERSATVGTAVRSTLLRTTSINCVRALIADRRNLPGDESSSAGGAARSSNAQCCHSNGGTRPARSAFPPKSRPEETSLTKQFESRRLR
jgi:hypothetical protein